MGLATLAAVAFHIIALLAPVVLGGMCWTTPRKDNRCMEVLKTQVSREDCCAGGSTTTAWSRADLTSGDLFKKIVLEQGVLCEMCKNSCEGVTCEEGKQCIVRNKKPMCVCAPKCSKKRRRSGPVCGTDDRTYKHICRLLKRKCRKDKHLTVAYRGPCQSSCDKVICMEQKTCLLDQNLRPHCVRCKQVCPPLQAKRYLCGADNVTYNSLCHLKQAACHRGRAVQLAYKGVCKSEASCKTVRCPKGKRCLTDPDTGQPRCVTCPHRCKWPIMDPLCATNNQTYDSFCRMMQESCRQGTLLKTKFSGPCNMTEKYNSISVSPHRKQHQS